MAPKFLAIFLSLIFLNARLISAEDQNQGAAEAPTGRKLGKHNFPGIQGEAEAPTGRKPGKHAFPGIQGVAGAPTGRKLGKHAFPGPGLENAELSSREVSVSGEESTGPVSEEEVVKISHEHRRHHSFDKSVAGGGVILGGLATTFLVAIFCYIRATRRKSDVHPGSPDSLSSSGGRKMVEPGNLSS